MVKYKCEYCGQEREAKYPSHVKRYCSPRCATMAKWESRPKGETTKLTCLMCGKEFELLTSTKNTREKNGKKVRYCSKECGDKSRRTREIVACKNCGKEFETTRNEFCSHKCVSEYRKKTGLAKKNGWWLENGYKVLYLDGDKSIKEHIKVMQDYLGRELTSEEVVHHINGDRLDNGLENLQLMTRGEHSRLHRKDEKGAGKHLFGGYHNN